nr:Trafficking kinesin-binding protein like [Ipomoea batatas]
MEVMVPFRGLEMDFDFNSARASPCVTAPSTPRGFGDYYLSAPTSPSHLSQLYRDFDDFLIDDDEGKSAAEFGVPFSWEEKPGKPKKGEDVFDFAFDVGEECETDSVSAEDLFDGGMIKPLEPPPPCSYGGRGKKSKIGGFSPRHKRKSESFGDEIVSVRERGRERVSSLQSSSRRATRSVSPLRVSQYPWEEQQDSAKAPPLTSSSSSKGLVKKWRLKDFFLFRSASEGRASDKDHLSKYTAAVVKGSSFRGGNNDSLSRRRRRGPISAHELHYTFNKAISEDLKKKTFLPYKQGILGKLAFNPAVHALANGFGLSRK